MSATLQLTHQLTGSVPKVDVGSLIAAAISVTNGIAYSLENEVIADNYTQATLWTSGAGGITSFQFGVLISNADIWIQLKNDKGTPEFALILVPANLPFYFSNLAGGVATTDRLDGAQLIAATDFGSVVDIQVQRNVADAVGDATISFFLFK